VNVLKISEKRIFNISHRNFYACISVCQVFHVKDCYENLRSKMVLHQYFKVVGEDMVWCIFSEENNIFWLSRTPLAPIKQTWGRKRVIVNLQIFKFCVFLSFKHLQDFSDDVAKALPSTLHTHSVTPFTHLAGWWYFNERSKSAHWFMQKWVAHNQTVLTPSSCC